MDFVTILALSNGVQMLYKFVKVINIYYSSVEIANKITVSTVIKHVNNANDVYEITTFMMAAKNPSSIKDNKKKVKKLNSVPNNRNMKKLYKIAFDIGHYWYVRDLKAAEKRAEYRKEYLFNERQKEVEINDKVKELEMFEIGYLRDELSRHYISPSNLLNDIADGLIKNMTSAKWTVADKELIKRIVTEQGDIDSFKKYEDLFYYVDVLDRITKRPFKSILLNDVVYSVKTILMLQEKKRSMIYVNVAVKEHENKCVQ